MTLREWMLAALLVVAGALVVVGVSIMSTSGAWITAGVLIAGFAWLMLGEA